MTTPLVIRLPRLPINFQDQPETFRRYWDEAMNKIESSLNAILALPEIEAAIAAAQAAAEAANDAAENAQEAADAVTTDTSIQNSYVTDLTLEAFNDGADCHVDISAHFRIYGDNPTPVAVDGGTLTGIDFDTVVRIYYDDPTRAGGAVVYQWSSDESVAAQTGDRHVVGAVVTPRATEPGSVIGGGVKPPGYVIP